MKILKALILAVAFLSVAISPQPVQADDGKIAFASDRDGDFEIFRMDSGGLDQTQITHNYFHDSDPSLGPSSQFPQSSSTSTQAPFGNSQTPSGTFEEEGLVLPQQWWTITIELVLGNQVVITYTSNVKAVGGYAVSEDAVVIGPGVILNVTDPLGYSIYSGEQAADGGTEFTAELNGTYELTFLNPAVRNLQEVKVEYQVNATPIPSPTPTRPSLIPTPSIPRPTSAANDWFAARAQQLTERNGLDMNGEAVQGTPSPGSTNYTERDLQFAKQLGIDVDSSDVQNKPSPSPTPAPEPTPERGFFVNSLPSKGNSGDWNFMDPVTLSIIGITLTLFGTLVQLFRGR